MWCARFCVRFGAIRNLVSFCLSGSIYMNENSGIYSGFIYEWMVWVSIKDCWNCSGSHVVGMLVIIDSNEYHN